MLQGYPYIPGSVSQNADTKLSFKSKTSELRHMLDREFDACEYTNLQIRGLLRFVFVFNKAEDADQINIKDLRLSKRGDKWVTRALPTLLYKEEARAALEREGINIVALEDIPKFIYITKPEVH